MVSKTNGSQSQFEISLIVIAILIPLFLESLPAFADRLTAIFSIPLRLNMMRTMSLLLGMVWFGVLVIGLYQFHSNKKILFNKLFEFSLQFTVLISLVLFFSYIITLVNLYFGYEIIINLIFVILGIVVMWKSFGSIKK